RRGAARASAPGGGAHNPYPTAIAPADRGRGLGRLLMEEAMRRLYREGASACFLEVNEANAAAVRLYRALVFEVVGERKGYYQASQTGEGTALVMRVQLR